MDFIRPLLIGWLAIFILFSLGSGFIHLSVQALYVTEWGVPWRAGCFAAMVYWMWVGVKADFL